jgi:hypothetical protein
LKIVKPRQDPQYSIIAYINKFQIYNFISRRWAGARGRATRKGKIKTERYKEHEKGKEIHIDKNVGKGI